MTFLLLSPCRLRPWITWVSWQARCSCRWRNSTGVWIPPRYPAASMSSLSDSRMELWSALHFTCALERWVSWDHERKWWVVPGYTWDNNMLSDLPMISGWSIMADLLSFCQSGGHWDQWGTCEFAHEVRREWRSVFCQGDERQSGAEQKRNMQTLTFCSPIFMLVSFLKLWSH